MLVGNLRIWTSKRMETVDAPLSTLISLQKHLVRIMASPTFSKHFPLVEWKECESYITWFSYYFYCVFMLVGVCACVCVHIWTKVSVCSQCCVKTGYVGHAGVELTEICLSLSPLSAGIKDLYHCIWLFLRLKIVEFHFVLWASLELNMIDQACLECK